MDVLGAWLSNNAKYGRKNIKRTAIKRDFGWMAKPLCISQDLMGGECPKRTIIIIIRVIYQALVPTFSWKKLLTH
jgi:hypothetical protein